MPLPPAPRFEPDPATLAGQNADVYFRRTQQVLQAEGLAPVVAMEVFARQRALLCGMREVEGLLREVLAGVAGAAVERLPEGCWLDPGEVVLRIAGPYRAFGLYETALIGTLASETGWATAAAACVDAAGTVPVVHFGARHVHPDVSRRLEYAAVVGGCAGCATPAGAALAGLEASGTMPHALILLFGDTVPAAVAFDRSVPAEVKRTVLVDTFLDEADESARVAEALGARLWGVRLDTPAELGGVTPEVVARVRARLDGGGHGAVRILVSGGLTPARIRRFREAGSAIDGFGVGSAISGAAPVDFTADVKEVDGRAVAKRGRRPGRTQNPRLEPLELP